jgi:hypothetical protein
MYNLTDDDLQAAIEATEQEIWSEAAPGAPDMDELLDNETLLDDLSQMSDWNGNGVPDGKLAGEAAGNTDIGMTLAVDDDDLDAARQAGYEAGAQQAFQQLSPYLPRHEPADMFADPEGFRRELLEEARGGQGVMPVSPPSNSVDMFSDPQGFRQQTINDIRTQRAIDQWQEDRINSSMGHAHRRYGEDFERAYTNVTKGLDASNPAHRNLVNGVITSSDPGNAIMQANDFLQMANASAERYGGPPFARGLVRRGAPLRNSAGDGPRSREEALEQSIFNDATGHRRPACRHEGPFGSLGPAVMDGRLSCTRGRVSGSDRSQRNRRVRSRTRTSPCRPRCGADAASKRFHGRSGRRICSGNYSRPGRRVSQRSGCEVREWRYSAGYVSISGTYADSSAAFAARRIRCVYA